MTRRAGRRIRSKTARTMLSFRHYEFKKRLKWKAWQLGAVVLDVNEAYTSKTCSWDAVSSPTWVMPVSSGTEMVSGWIET